jgi:hypothetical protein
MKPIVTRIAKEQEENRGSHIQTNKVKAVTLQNIPPTSQFMIHLK